LTYRGTTLHEIPPSGQGIAACMALGILENFELAGRDPDGPEVAHLRIEAMKLAFADIYRYVADPRFMEVTPAQMLDKGYLKSRAKLIDPKKAQDFGPGTPKESGTIYLGTADESGMMVSLIQSNYTGFGSGVMVPGTGIALQNRATGFVTTKGHPNEVGPRKRPFHTIIPAFITKDGKPVATFGLMGGAMQPQGHMQVFSRIVDYGQNPQAAIDAARWRVHETDGTVWTEDHFPTATATGLESRGHKLTRTGWPSFAFGSSQIIWRFPDGGPYLGASESRRDGAAVGF
ncbi:MAG: gamma-glutamyltransferase, partial [Rhodospirillales bacterium]|nr:gamma-glutamyltransferase [Rhodospirillales bacterium]